MSTRRLTQQDIDPIAGLTSATLTPLAAVVATGVAIALTLAHWSEVHSEIAAASAVAAIALVVAAGIAATLATRPSRSPVTPERFWVVVALGVGAAVAEYFSTIGHDEFLYDDFGPVVIGILVISFAPYCNWPSLLTAGVLSSAVLAVLAVGAANPTWENVPLGSMIFVFVAPTLMSTCAAAGYSWAIVRVTLEWQRKANQVVLARDAELRAGLARSLDHGRVAVLRREVIPFLAGMLTVERVSVADADRARLLAESLRAALHSEQASTWLGDLAAELERRCGVEVVVVDPASAASSLHEGQRAALTSLMTWLADGRASAVRVAVSVEPAASDHGRIVRFEVGGPLGEEPPHRREVERFGSVARAVGLVADVGVTRENVRVELRHESR